MRDYLEREEEALADEYNRGDITAEEYRKALRELHRDYDDAARDAAQDAYDRERDRW